MAGPAFALSSMCLVPSKTGAPDGTPDQDWIADVYFEALLFVVKGGPGIGLAPISIRMRCCSHIDLRSQRPFLIGRRHSGSYAFAFAQQTRLGKLEFRALVKGDK